VALRQTLPPPPQHRRRWNLGRPTRCGRSCLAATHGSGLRACLCRTYCRGGPPWPPSVGRAPVNIGLIKTTGGHGGPPLQYVPKGKIFSWLVNATVYYLPHVETRNRAASCFLFCSSPFCSNRV